MLDWIEREVIYLWYYLDIQLRQILPYWALGILLGSAVSVFGKRWIHGAFAGVGRGRWGWLGVVPASLLGIASPLCMYGTIPIAASFSRQGVRDDHLAAFMMASVLLNPQLLLYSAALGQAALIIRFVSCFLCGCAAGWLVRVFFRDRPFFNFSGFHTRASRDTHPNALVRYLLNVLRNIRTTAPWFAVGVLLTALYQIHVPREWAAELFGGGGFGVLLAATLGVPLYMCGGGTIPLLLEWLASGMTLGSAAAFMLTGPATKITNLGALKTVLGIRHFLLYIGFVMVFSFITGMAVNAFGMMT